MKPHICCPMLLVVCLLQVACGAPPELVTLAPSETPSFSPTPVTVPPSIAHLQVNGIELTNDNYSYMIPGEINPGDVLRISIVISDDESGVLEILGDTHRYDVGQAGQVEISLTLPIQEDLVSAALPLRLVSGADREEYSISFVPGSEWTPWVHIEDPTGLTGYVSIDVKLIDLNGSETAELTRVEQEFNFQATGDKETAEYISNHDISPFIINEVATGLYKVGFEAKWPGRYPFHFILEGGGEVVLDQRIPIEIHWKEQPFEIRGLGTGWIVPGDPSYYDDFFDILEDSNINLLQILVAGHMESIHANEVRDCEHVWSPDSACSGVSFESARRLINEAHTRDIAVMLAPQVVPGRFAPTWQIAPASWNSWFSLHPEVDSYSNWILGWAEFAEQNDVEIFSVGNELTSSHWQEAHWRSLIAEVRDVYGGFLTYADNYWVFWGNSEYAPFPACDELDMQGVNFYFRGSGDLYAGPALSDPTPDQMHDSLSNQVQHMLLAERESSCAGIPILITETGIMPIDGDNVRPEGWDSYSNPMRDNQEQVDFFTSIMTVAADQRFIGVIFWQLQPQRQAWSRIIGIPGDLKDLPALDTLRVFFHAP